MDQGDTPKQGGKRRQPEVSQKPRGSPRPGRANFCDLSWPVPKGEGKVRSSGKAGDWEQGQDL